MKVAFVRSRIFYNYEQMKKLLIKYQI